MNILMNTICAMSRWTSEEMCRIFFTGASFLQRRANHVLMFVGAMLLVGGLIDFSSAAVVDYHQPSFNDTLIRNAVGQLLQLIEGAFGALIMVVAGLGAIVAASMGAYRLAVSMLVVAVGAFILRALVSLFFGENFEAIANT